MMKKLVTACGLAAVCLAAIAGTVVRGYDLSEVVAVEKANHQALQGALMKGTCMSEWADPGQCTKDAENAWTCTAVYANQRGSCRGKYTVLEDVNRAAEAVKNASAAAAALTAGK